MIEGEDPPALVNRSTVGFASCMTTILALPIMLLFVLLLTLLPNSTGIDGYQAIKALLALPIVAALGVFGFYLYPISAGMAFLSIVTAAWWITRRKQGQAWLGRTSWLLAGAPLGLAVGAMLSVEQNMPSRHVGIGTLLVSGMLTGMAAMLICRHLVRSFEG